VEKISFEPGVLEKRSNGWWSWWRMVKGDEGNDELTCEIR